MSEGGIVSVDAKTHKIFGLNVPEKVTFFNNKVVLLIGEEINGEFHKACYAEVWKIR